MGGRRTDRHTDARLPAGPWGGQTPPRWYEGQARAGAVAWERPNLGLESDPLEGTLEAFAINAFPSPSAAGSGAATRTSGELVATRACSGRRSPVQSGSATVAPAPSSAPRLTLPPSPQAGRVNPIVPTWKLRPGAQCPHRPQGQASASLAGAPAVPSSQLLCHTPAPGRGQVGTGDTQAEVCAALL